MAIIRAKELKGLSENELSKKLSEIKLEALKSRKPSHGASVKNKEIRRTVARILTQVAYLRSQAKKDNKK